MPVHPDLLAIVRCPKCRGSVVEKTTTDGPGLVCGACHLAYLVVDDIPNFLIDEARPYPENGGA